MHFQHERACDTALISHQLIRQTSTQIRERQEMTKLISKYTRIMESIFDPDKKWQFVDGLDMKAYG